MLYYKAADRAAPETLIFVPVGQVENTDQSDSS